MTKYPFIVTDCVLIVLRPDLFLPDNRPILINTDRALRAPREGIPLSDKSSWVPHRPTNDSPYLVDASNRQFTRFEFKSLRNPEDCPSIFSLLVNADSKLQSVEGPSNPDDLKTFIRVTRNIVGEIFHVPGVQGQPLPRASLVSPSPSAEDSDDTITPTPTRPPGSGDDRRGRDSMDLGLQGGGSVEESSYDAEEDDEEDEDPDTINGLTFPEMRTVLQRVSDGTISDEERAEAAMLMLGMAGGALFTLLHFAPLFLIPDTRSSVSAGDLSTDPHIGRTSPTRPITWREREWSDEIDQCERVVRLGIIVLFYSYLRFDRPLPTEYTPGRCLPFDRIGARHPGMTHRAGARYPANTCPRCCVHP